MVHPYLGLTILPDHDGTRQPPTNGIQFLKPYKVRVGDGNIFPRPVLDPTRFYVCVNNK